MGIAAAGALPVHDMRVPMKYEHNILQFRTGAPLLSGNPHMGLKVRISVWGLGIGFMVERLIIGFGAFCFSPEGCPSWNGSRS